MFDNFTFATTPRSPSLASSNASSTDSISPSISPCTSPTSAEFPFPRYSVGDLAVNFANHHIRTEAQMFYHSCDAYAATDDDAGWELESLPARPSNVTSVSRMRTALPSRSHSPSRRSQRQASARLLCSTAHHKDIAALVARMVDSEDQCSVAPPESLTQPQISPILDGDDDEGYDSSDAMDTPLQSRRSSFAVPRCRLEYRRSADLKANGACVNKAVRLRKASKHRRGRSSETES